ncbi:MAG: biotin/lipoyl-containing protein, partial [Pirellulales bacterium]
MPIELKVPTVGESITEVQVGQWLKGEGEWADKDQPLVEIESDKATVELLAPQAGTVARVLKGQGQTANVGEVIGYLEASKDPHQPDAQARTQHQPDAPARERHQPDAQPRTQNQPDAQARDSSAAQPAAEQPPAELERAQ